MTQQLVLVHHSNQIAWAEALELPVVVYLKGPDARSSSREWYRLPNVGWDGYAYLTHIIEQWDNLADYTLFCQDDPSDHFPAGVSPLSLLEEDGAPWRGHFMQVREWDIQGRLVFPPKWAKRWRDGSMRRATQTLAEWFMEWFGLDLMGMDHITYIPGANFVASREAIQHRPRDLYCALRERISDAVEPEECHYLERSWCYLLEERVKMRWPRFPRR